MKAFIAVTSVFAICAVSVITAQYNRDSSSSSKSYATTTLHGNYQLLYTRAIWTCFAPSGHQPYRQVTRPNTTSRSSVTTSTSRSHRCCRAMPGSWRPRSAASRCRRACTRSAGRCVCSCRSAIGRPRRARYDHPARQPTLLRGVGWGAGVAAGDDQERRAADGGRVCAARGRARARRSRADVAPAGPGAGGRGGVSVGGRAGGAESDPS